MAAAAAAIHTANARKEAEKNKKKSPKADADTDINTPPAVVVEPEEFTGWRKYQPAALRLYNHIVIQVGVAGLIGLNFLINILQAQIDPNQDQYIDEFGVFDLFFNVVFFFELILNMYSSWCCKFWKSGWNIFDFLVVVIGWMFQLNLPLPGPMKLLRMMRAFRVFRLFKRVKSLKKIMDSLANAIPGVMNAFLIQLIVMCIYAIIAVDRFQDYGEGGFFVNEGDKEIPLKTGRGQDFGFEYFGDFGKSLYTMFQVLTGESWSEVVCRPLFHSNNPTTSMGAAFFFVTFMIVNAVVLINVVVAVLLEKMVDDPAEAAGGGEEEEEDDPLQDNVDQTLADVAELRGQMDQLISANATMQKQLNDVDNIKEQLSALLAHNGIKQVSPRPTLSLNSAALGDDPTGLNRPEDGLPNALANVDQSTPTTELLSTPTQETEPMKVEDS